MLQTMQFNSYHPTPPPHWGLDKMADIFQTTLSNEITIWRSIGSDNGFAPTNKNGGLFPDAYMGHSASMS